MNGAYNLNFNSNNVNPQNGNNRANGFSVRPLREHILRQFHFYKQGHRVSQGLRGKDKDVLERQAWIDTP